MSYLNMDLVIECLRELADQKRQEVLWLSDGQGERLVSSFTEVTEQLLTDSGLGDLLHEVNLGLPQGANESLMKLAHMLLEMGGMENSSVNTYAIEFIRSKKMEMVRREAVQCLQKLGQLMEPDRP